MLTRAHRVILSGILTYYDKNKIWPTPTNVAQLLNIAESTADRAYAAFIARGYLTRSGHGRYRPLHAEENALDILQCIYETMIQHGYCPTNTELSEKVHLNVNAIARNLRSLESMGYIRIVHDEFGRYFEIRRFR